MRILNLGCGGKPSSHPEVLNIDWSICLRLKTSPIMRRLAPFYLSGERLLEFKSVPENIMVKDISSGLPFDNDSVDMVYHCHVLEHIDRSQVEGFMEDIRRVLKPGGIHRIVVPDFELLMNQYITHLELCRHEQDQRKNHDTYVSNLLEQSVRKESYGTSQQTGLRRMMETLIFGDARRRGETHQWMYDEFNLASILYSSGYTSVRKQTYTESLYPDWNDLGLDLNAEGNEYKPGSLYMEAVK